MSHDAIPLKSAVCCVDCQMITRPTEHGRCGFCGSAANYWLIGAIDNTFFHELKFGPKPVKA